eukprot:1160104-Pelagomonas_calceolata.AAC.5
MGYLWKVAPGLIGNRPPVIHICALSSLARTKQAFEPAANFSLCICNSNLWHLKHLKPSTFLYFTASSVDAAASMNCSLASIQPTQEPVRCVAHPVGTKERRTRIIAQHSKFGCLLVLTGKGCLSMP